MVFYLDLDGVLTDFNRPAMAVIGVEHPPAEWHWYAGIPNGFQRVNDACTVDFWANLSFMPDGREILREVCKKIRRGIDEFYLLTTPMPNPGSWTGKYLWVERNLPEWKLIVTNAPKRLLASPDAILIDDNDTNIQEWVAAGGIGILVPRPWNELRGWSEEALQVVKNSLESI